MSLKSLIPGFVKVPLRALHRSRVLRAALRQTDGLMRDDRQPPSKLIDELIYGWGNEGWSAKSALLSFLLKEFRNFSGTALECGSGISTLLFTMIAKRTGARMYCLEHDAEWLKHVLARSRKMGLPANGLVLTPLKTFGSYAWYDIEGRLPADAGIDLVLCDGPPENTPGGRYGLLPSIQKYLRPGALVIMDDAHRSSEQEIVQRWLTEYPGRLRVARTFPTFVVLEMH